LSEWSDGGADLSLETSGKQAGFGLAVAAVAPGGRIVCNGYQPGVDYGLDSAKLVLEEIRVQGSRAGNRQMSQESLAAVERGDVKPPIMDVVPLAAAPEALQMLAEGRVRGRIVVDPTR